MSVPDKAMGYYFRLVTSWTPPEIEALEKGMEEGSLHPRDVKMKLAREIVSIYHDDEAAARAEGAFKLVFQQGNIPTDMPEIAFEKNQTVLDVLVNGKLVSSKSEGRRMVDQNAVRLDGETLKDPNQQFPHPGVLQVGKRRYIRVK